MRRVRPRARRAAPGATRHVPSTCTPSTTPGPVQPFGRAQHDHRPARALADAVLARLASGAARISAYAVVERGGERLVDRLGLVAGDEAAAGGRSPRAVAAARRRRSAPAPSGSRSSSRSGAGSAARRRRWPDRGTCSRASSPPAGRSPPRRRRSRTPRAGRGCRARRRRRAPASSRARRPRGSSPGVSGATWLGTPPGNENWRNSCCMPAVVLRDGRPVLGVGALEPGAGAHRRAAVARARR